jgi:hypothetical protein
MTHFLIFFLPQRREFGPQSSQCFFPLTFSILLLLFIVVGICTTQSNKLNCLIPSNWELIEGTQGWAFQRGLFQFNEVARMVFVPSECAVFGQNAIIRIGIDHYGGGGEKADQQKHREMQPSAGELKYIANMN